MLTIAAKTLAWTKILVLLTLAVLILTFLLVCPVWACTWSRGVTWRRACADPHHGAPDEAGVQDHRRPGRIQMTLSGIRGATLRHAARAGHATRPLGPELAVEEAGLVSAGHVLAEDVGAPPGGVTPRHRVSRGQQAEMRSGFTASLELKWVNCLCMKRRENQPDL
jgi:hypothetical protein